MATKHKFKIGQTVFFRPKLRRTGMPPSNRPYRVVQRLFVLVGEPQYRIRGSDQEVAARESELRPMQAFATRY